jgi:hypothetical protein
MRTCGSGRRSRVGALAIGFLLLALPAGRPAAQPIQSAKKALTTEQRLQAVEAKTDFYVKTIKTLSQSYKKGRAGSQWQCTATKMTLTVNPKITLAGTSYVWATAAVKLAGSLGPGSTAQFSFWTTGKPLKTCDLYSDVKTTTATYKKYCALEVEAKDKFQFVFDLSDGGGTLRACDHVASVDLELKLVNVGIEEPK